MLVNKLCSTGYIVRWFLILLEFDFIVVVKEGISHQQSNHVSKINNEEDHVGVPDDLPNAYLFNVEFVPNWSKDIVFLLTIGTLCLSNHVDANLAIIENSQHYHMVVGWLYQMGVKT